MRLTPKTEKLGFTQADESKSPLGNTTITITNRLGVECWIEHQTDEDKTQRWIVTSKIHFDDGGEPEFRTVDIFTNEDAAVQTCLDWHWSWGEENEPKR